MRKPITDLIHHPYKPPANFGAPQAGVYKASTVFFADVAWSVVVLVAVGSVVGAQLGATVGRRLPAPALRGVIVVVGLVAAIKLLV